MLELYKNLKRIYDELQIEAGNVLEDLPSVDEDDKQNKLAYKFLTIYKIAYEDGYEKGKQLGQRAA